MGLSLPSLSVTEKVLDLLPQLKAVRKTGLTFAPETASGELRRLQRSYRYSFKGEERWGTLNGFNWALFETFVREKLQHVKTFQGTPERIPWSRWEGSLAMPDSGKTRPPPSFIALYELRKAGF